MSSLPAPQVLRDANVLIVGGGPSASVAAAMLHQRGVQATLVEQQEDFLSFEVNRSYVLGVNERGRRVLKTVPSLFDYVMKDSTSAKYLRRIGGDGSVSVLDFPYDVYGKTSFFTRFRLLHTLKQFIAEHTDTKTHYGTKVTDIQFLPSGDMDVTIRHQGCKNSNDSKTGELEEDRIEVLRTRFIIACDGRNSAVVEALRKASAASKTSANDEKLVHSKQGFDTYSIKSPSVGLGVRSIVMKCNSALLKFGLTENFVTQQISSISGDARNRPNHRQFRFTHFPISDIDQKHINGFLLTAVRPADNALWKCQSEDECFELFQENFPELDVRACITPESMRDFVRANKSNFPTISRPRSIAASIGIKGENQGGVVIAGDAAHSFPPDIGEGVNSAFEDLKVLMDVVDTLGPDASIDSIVRGYDAARDSDVWALIRIAQIAVPYQYGQSYWGLLMTSANYIFRKKLSSWFPNLFNPALMGTLKDPNPFSEKLQKVNQTTLRIWVALALLLIPSLAFAIFLAFRSSNVGQ